MVMKKKLRGHLSKLNLHQDMEKVPESSMYRQKKSAEEMSKVKTTEIVN